MSGRRLLDDHDNRLIRGSLYNLASRREERTSHDRLLDNAVGSLGAVM
jgi:hypothetical protein